MGIQTTQQRLIHSCYFPGLYKAVEHFVTSCLACQQKNKKPTDQKHTLASTQVGDTFQKLSIDLVGPLVPSPEGYIYILTVKCCFSRWTEGIPLKDAKATTVAKALEREIFARYGLPQQIHSDQGVQFMSNLFEEVCQILHITRTNPGSYSPKSCAVERSHSLLGSILRAVGTETGQHWVDILPTALLAMNTARCRSTGVSAYYCMFGRECRMPLDCMFPNPYEQRRYRTAYGRDLGDRLLSVHSFMRDNIKKSTERSRANYNGKLDSHPLEVSDLVWLYTPRLQVDRGSKLSIVWTGPYVVTDKISTVLFKIKSHGRWNKNKLEAVVSIDRLKRFYFPQKEVLVPTHKLTNEDIQLEDEFIEYGGSIVESPTVQSPSGRAPASSSSSPPPAPPALPAGTTGRTTAADSPDDGDDEPPPDDEEDDPRRDDEEDDPRPDDEEDDPPPLGLTASGTEGPSASPPSSEGPSRPARPPSGSDGGGGAPGEGDELQPWTAAEGTGSRSPSSVASGDDHDSWNSMTEEEDNNSDVGEWDHAFDLTTYKDEHAMPSVVVPGARDDLDAEDEAEEAAEHEVQRLPGVEEGGQGGENSRGHVGADSSERLMKARTLVSAPTATTTTSRSSDDSTSARKTLDLKKLPHLSRYVSGGPDSIPRELMKTVALAKRGATRDLADEQRIGLKTTQNIGSRAAAASVFGGTSSVHTGQFLKRKENPAATAAAAETRATRRVSSDASSTHAAATDMFGAAKSSRATSRQVNKERAQAEAAEERRNLTEKREREKSGREQRAEQRARR
jgi:hypothetical protein